ncbi:cora-like Mg2+ transporter protein-domain-containing protein [Dactylonectria macrodidyma]|uniref:Cora-like Mg2+ transporter protein-domain-containing protein n=1 Tax=Dactylonectria macrodidyma TaxID=307937 RepID=A0A9P9JAH0_9HYPO|nr:cora-like Mg2+ transporter protein-domain-containing protein [Dactylonectria macrodidyma]
MAAPTSTQPNLDDLIRAAEVQHEHHVRTLRSLHEGMTMRRIDSQPRSIITIPEPFTPPLRALSVPTFASDNTTHAAPLGTSLRRRARAATLETTAERPALTPEVRPVTLSGSPAGSHIAVFSSHDDDVSFIPLLDSTSAPPPSNHGRCSDDFTPIRRPLVPMHFPDDQLLRHLRDTDFTPEMARLLEDALRRRGDIDLSMSFRDFAAYEREGYSQATFEVYEVGRDALPVKLSADIEMDMDGPTEVKYTGDGPYENPLIIVDAPTVWEAIGDVNPDAQSVGRITIVQEPTPLILAALHLTMSPHFDMSELIAHLLTDAPNRGRTHASMHNRAFERAPLTLPSSPYSSPSPTALPVGATATLHPSPSLSSAHLRQRSFFFVFKYYTVVGTNLTPAPWQRFDKRPLDKRLGDHIDIAECGSILALSLGGDPTKTVRMRPRREPVREGCLFDTFGPWHLLSIQSFPDNAHTVRDDEFQDKEFINGPCAFLDLLIAEYRDAGKRNQILHESITKLITPKTEFMFDPKLRDKLLFEDKHFTYIRRYFWAYNTLAVVNTGIKAMMSAYFDTFTDDFWDGTHPILWPHPAPESPAGLAYRNHMAILRRELDKVVRELGEVLKRNERTRKEIENLRDQLFSGSSIKESRRAIEQGDNIRILTMISMIFLPLTFVTSVFGMTEFEIPATDWRFAVTMVLVCVPFMLLISLLQTRSFGLLVTKLSAAASLPRRLFAFVLSRGSRDSDPPDNRSTAALSQRRVPVRRAGRWTWPWGSRRAQLDEGVDLGGDV